MYASVCMGMLQLTCHAEILQFCPKERALLKTDGQRAVCPLQRNLNSLQPREMESVLVRTRGLGEISQDQYNSLVELVDNSVSSCSCRSHALLLT